MIPPWQFHYSLQKTRSAMDWGEGAGRTGPSQLWSGDLHSDHPYRTAAVSSNVHAMSSCLFLQAVSRDLTHKGLSKLHRPPCHLPSTWHLLAPSLRTHLGAGGDAPPSPELQTKVLLLSFSFLSWGSPRELGRNCTNVREPISHWP